MGKGKFCTPNAQNLSCRVTTFSSQYLWHPNRNRSRLFSLISRRDLAPAVGLTLKIRHQLSCFAKPSPYSEFC